MLQIGDKVRPSKKCRTLYGDPELMTIIDATRSVPTAYICDTYPDIFFEEYELERINELITAQEALDELEDAETYTREEVYQVAWYVLQKTRTIIAKQKDWSVLFSEEQIKYIINSEIDTVKIF